MGYAIRKKRSQCDSDLALDTNHLSVLIWIDDLFEQLIVFGLFLLIFAPRVALRCS